MTPRRGEVWWVRLDPTQGSEIRKTRPCVVLTANVLNGRRRTVVVVPLTTGGRSSPPILVPVSLTNRTCFAVVDQIRAVAKERLDRRSSELSAKDLAALEIAVRDVLDLD